MEDIFEIKYEAGWKLLPPKYSCEYNPHHSWNLYKNGNVVACIANFDGDPNDIVIENMCSIEKGMMTKLIFMLLLFLKLGFKS
jgi:hypothetical protein